MKTLATILAAALLAVGTTSFAKENVFPKRISASNNYVTKQYNVKDFNAIQISGSGNVYFTQKEGAPSVSMVTADNVAEIMEVYVENKTLYIKFKKGYSVSNLKKLDFTISAASINRMGIIGSGDIKLMNGLKTDAVELFISGSGDIKCDNVTCTGDANVSITGSGDIEGKGMTCRNLDTHISGSGDIELEIVNSESVEAVITGSGDYKLKGKTEKASYRISGSGDLNAKDLEAADVTAAVYGSGDISCHASRSIKATRSGSGEIGYRGNPSSVDISKKGVHHIE